MSDSNEIVSFNYFEAIVIIIVVFNLFQYVLIAGFQSFLYEKIKSKSETKETVYKVRFFCYKFK